MLAEELRESLRERDLLPHQVDFIEAALASGSGGRLLLADAVGLGKTHACIALVWAWGLRHNRYPRTIILAPGVTLTRWQAGLAEFGVVDAEIVDAASFRHLEARTRPDENPWNAVATALTTVDFLGRGDRLESLLKASWDVVIVDEAHVGTPSSQKGRVLRTLWNADVVDLMVAASATPSGRLDDLLAADGRTTQVLHRVARDLVDWNGEPLLGDATSQLVDVAKLTLSAQEGDLFEATKAVLRDVPVDEPLERFVVQLYVRAAASSLFTLENLLRRALLRFDLPGDASAAEVDPKTPEADILDDLTGAAFRSPLAREDLMRLIALIDLVEVDSKWRECAKVLQSGLLEAGGGAVLFCDFVYTAQYVAGLISEAGIPVELVTAATPTEVKERVIGSFRDHAGVLVLTSGAAEGTSLSFVKLCLHYDLPWNPTALAQRLGRIHRVGAPPGAVRHVLFADDVLLREPLVRALFSLDEDGGGKVAVDALSDILGFRQT